ncbi:hypothetical protein VP01_4633g1 [Puccinia sorghi]|uniref:Uncharacterized protein n=1 Tax=Puccinia sorghi TaxID=27349 RepID=A0A0L6UND7_9BASI|nr:hypothetical protein VP01_4633g1 [Puccinia sorghi]
MYFMNPENIKKKDRNKREKEQNTYFFHFKHLGLPHWYDLFQHMWILKGESDVFFSHSNQSDKCIFFSLRIYKSMQDHIEYDNFLWIHPHFLAWMGFHTPFGHGWVSTPLFGVDGHPLPCMRHQYKLMHLSIKGVDKIYAKNEEHSQLLRTSVVGKKHEIFNIFFFPTKQHKFPGKMTTEQHLMQQDGKGSQISQHSLTKLTCGNQDDRSTPFDGSTIRKHLHTPRTQRNNPQIYIPLLSLHLIYLSYHQIRSLVPRFYCHNRFVTNYRVRHSNIITLRVPFSPISIPLHHNNSSVPDVTCRLVIIYWSWCLVVYFPSKIYLP